METFIVIGLIFQTMGSILLLGGYAPQIIKLHRTLVPTGISLLFWTMIGTGCTTILINMILQGTSFPVVATQALNALGAWYTLGLVIYCKKLRGESLNVNDKILLVYLLIIIFFLYDFLHNPISLVGNHLQIVGTVALLTAYLPQIFHLNKVKDATGISRWLFIVLGSGLLLVTVNMFITGTNLGIIATELVNIALIMVQYGMTVYYQNRSI
ncbi:PQ-loop domain-containing transporter [Bacillus spizizenii]|nr:PQ-loop domain-containing transporter [Bacillus spizizenii]MCY9124985.1 PQ-loop domain-containing transporter [Bacillus spizizenii]